MIPHDTAYDALRRARPELFVNEPGGFEILTDPEEVEAARKQAAGAGGGEAGPVGVVYADRFVTVVRDAVRFPGGALGLYVRVLPASAEPGVVVLPLLCPAAAGPDRAEQAGQAGQAGRAGRTERVGRDAGADVGAGGPDHPEGVVFVEHYRHATRSWHLEVPRGNGEAGIPGEESAARELTEELGTTPVELVPLGGMYPDTGLLGAGVELFAARIGGVGPVGTEEGIRRAVTVSCREAEAMVRDGAVTDGFSIAVLARARLAGLLG